MPLNTISITSSSHQSTSWLRVESAKGSAFPSHQLYVWGARSGNYHGTLQTIITVFADRALRLSLLASRVCRLDVALAPPTGSQLIGQTSEFGADERIKKKTAHAVLAASMQEHRSPMDKHCYSLSTLADHQHILILNDLISSHHPPNLFPSPSQRRNPSPSGTLRHCLA